MQKNKVKDGEISESDAVLRRVEAAARQRASGMKVPVAKVHIDASVMVTFAQSGGETAHSRFNMI